MKYKKQITLSKTVMNHKKTFVLKKILKFAIIIILRINLFLQKHLTHLYSS